jgi:hypothetical protein
MAVTLSCSVRGRKHLVLQPTRSRCASSKPRRTPRETSGPLRLDLTDAGTIPEREIPAGPNVRPPRLRDSTNRKGGVGHYRHGDLASYRRRAHRAAASPRGINPGTLAASRDLGRVGACFVCFERVQGAGAAGDAGFAGAAVTHRRRLLTGATSSVPAGGRTCQPCWGSGRGRCWSRPCAPCRSLPRCWWSTPPDRTIPGEPGLRSIWGGAWAADGRGDHPAAGRPRRLARRPARCDDPAAAGWPGGGLLGADPGGRQAGGRPCRLANPNA